MEDTHLQLQQLLAYTQKLTTVINELVMENNHLQQQLTSTLQVNQVQSKEIRLLKEARHGFVIYCQTIEAVLRNAQSKERKQDI